MLTHQTIYRYLSILFFSALLLCSSASFAQQDAAYEEDTTVTVKVKKKDTAGHQLTLGIDVYRPVLSLFDKNRFAYEVSGTYYMRNEYYLTMEVGRGGSAIDSSYLKYSTTNEFARLGFNKSLLSRDGGKDWDMMFIGLAAGLANIHRSDATFIVKDNVWGNKAGSVPGTNFAAYWAEINGGIRVELFKNIFAGWTMRGRFILNKNSFKELTPLYVAGYGKGDKTATFDVNAYISYAIRWDRKKKAPATAVAPPPPVAPVPVVTDSTKALKPRMNIDKNK